MNPLKAGSSEQRTISAQDLSDNHSWAGFGKGFSRVIPPVRRKRHSLSSIFPLWTGRISMLDIILLLWSGNRVRTVITKLNSRIFQYIPGWMELNFQDISDAVNHTSVVISMLSTIYFGVFCGDGAFFLVQYF